MCRNGLKPVICKDITNFFNRSINPPTKKFRVKVVKSLEVWYLSVYRSKRVSQITEMEDHMVSTKPSDRVKSNKRVSTTKIEQLLSGAVSNTNESTLSSMAKIVASMGVSIPDATNLPPSLAGHNPGRAPAPIRVPRLTKPEVLMLTLMAKPEEWHMVRRSKGRRANVGLGGFGSCFELSTRTVGGFVNHYVRYTTSGIMSPQGHARYLALQEKLVKIQEAVESGAPIATSKGSGRTSVTGTRRAGVSYYTSLESARKFPLKAEERKFLEVVSRPNTRVLAAEHTTKATKWYTFRWKWQKYGFDMSQISIEQKKQDDGTFNIYVTCNGIPNESIRKLVDFLASKPIRKA